MDRNQQKVVNEAAEKLAGAIEESCQENLDGAQKRANR